MALSTLDLGSGDGSKKLPKKIQPGNHRVKIHRLELEPFTFIDGAYHAILHAETEPIDGFEGFLIDNDESKGRYQGQIGKIKASYYAFADGKTKSGIPVVRDRAILMFLQNLTRALNISDWMKEQHNQHSTIEDFVEAFNKTAPFKNVYMDACIAGREYENKDGYKDYNLFFPSNVNGVYAFGEMDSSKVLKFDEEKHIMKPKEPKQVDRFGDDDDIIVPKKSSSDFNLD